MRNLTPKNKLQLFLIMVYVGLLSGCTTVIEYELPKGTLLVQVNLMDLAGKSIPENGGVEVTLEGSTPLIKVSTDENGMVEISNLNSGTYNILFNKEGYTQYRLMSYQFVGGNEITMVNGYLYENSNAQIHDLTLSESDYYFYPNILLEADISDNDRGNSFIGRYFISNSPDVSYMDYQVTGVINEKLDYNHLQYNLRYNTETYPVDSKVYVIMYPASINGMQYIDIDSGQLIYTDINLDNGSSVASYTIK